MATAVKADSEILNTAGGSEAGAWIKTLSTERRAKIKTLHEIRPAGNLIAVVFVVMWAVSGVLIMTTNFWPLHLFCYATIGVVIHGMGNIMHEAIHGNLFRNALLDRIVGFLAGAPALFSFTAYKVTHLIHHRYNRTENDPDEMTNLSKNKKVLSLAFYTWFAVGIVLYLFHVPITALMRGRPREKRTVLSEYALLGLIYAALILSALELGFFGAVVHLWFVPMIFAMMYGNVRGWAEHTMTRPGHPLTQTRTVTSNRILSLLNLNLNYHIEHHLFPAMPWYNLPKLHAMLQDDYRQAGSFIYSSYLRFVLDAFRAGVHGLAPSR